MKIQHFYEAIKTQIEKRFASEKIPQAVQKFLSNLNAIFLDMTLETYIKMTRMTILVEGFYHSLPNDSDLRNDFLALRFQRWVSHFGTPTVSFLLSYKLQIAQTNEYFKNEDITSFKKPWEIDVTERSQVDDENGLIIDSKATSEVTMPE